MTDNDLPVGNAKNALATLLNHVDGIQDGMPEGIESPDVLAILPLLPPKARQYLNIRAHHEEHAAALREMGLTIDARKRWARTFPAFREAERAILAASGDVYARLARSILQRAGPVVAERQAQLAMAPDADKRDQAQAQQRAREQVLKATGALSEELAPDEMRIDLRVAMRRQRNA
jgi:hypothetical protein